MIWAQIYLGLFLLMGIAGFVLEKRTRRTPAELAINILTVAAPAALVLAYMIPGLFHYRATLLALMAITVVTNWLSGRAYVEELNAESAEEISFGSVFAGVILLLGPALWFGAHAYLQMG